MPYTGQVLPKGSKQTPAAPTPPPEPTGSSDRASQCSYWHAASYSLDPDGSDGTLSIVDHFGGKDTVSVWVDAS